jgi:hypothetical protein
MPPILVYLLRLTISLAVVWLFYQLLLRRLTFYGLNRWYLLGYSVLSFFIPLINIYPILREEGPVEEPYLIQFIPVVGQRHMVVAEAHEGIHWWAWLIGVFSLGAVVLLVRMVIRGWSLYRLRKSAQLIESGPLRIYQVNASIIPFSFGNSIYINQDLHTKQQWSDIILHEYVHITQRHTVDILVAELMCMLNWYNPFCWLIRWSIRQNLEFIADQQVLAKGVDKKGYQYHLLTVLGEPRYRLANNFNFSSLKKRIVMMNKIRSARLHLLKFLFVLPLAAVLLVAFRDKLAVQQNAMGREVTMRPEVAGTQGRGPVLTDGKMTTMPGGHGVKLATQDRPIDHRHTRDTIIRLRDSVPVHVLYVVNGEKMPGGWIANELPADSIGSIVVLKGAKALTFFGPRGENGAIVIRTKAYEAAHPVMMKDDAKRENPAALSGDGNSGKRPPLWVVDGQIWSNDSVKTLNPERIDHINVLKSAENTKQYGEKGKNGVIEITMKPKDASAVPYRAGVITMNGESHSEGNGQSIGVANGPREGQAKVIFDNGKQVAIADTIKMNGVIITTYHAGGN